MAVCTHVILLKTKSFAVCRVGSWICMLRNFICLTKINYRTWTVFFFRVSNTYEKSFWGFFSFFVYFCSSIINSSATFLSFPVFLSLFLFLPSFLPSLSGRGGGWQRMQNMKFHLMLFFWTSSVIILIFHMWISHVKMSHFPLTNEKLKC